MLSTLCTIGNGTFPYVGITLPSLECNYGCQGHFDLCDRALSTGCLVECEGYVDVTAAPVVKLLSSGSRDHNLLDLHRFYHSMLIHDDINIHSNINRISSA